MSRIRFDRRMGHFVFRWLFVVMALAASLGAVAAAPETAVPDMRIVPGLEEPLLATGPTGADEDAALSAAIAAYQNPATPPDDFAGSAKPFEAFLAAYPASAWRMAVLTDLGIGYYHAGYFTKAADAWQQAWIAGRTATAPQTKALADRAFGELVRMHARVGHADALEALFADAGDRPISGPATEMVTGAHEGLWSFRHDWSRAYLCGPMALRNLLVALKADPAKIAAMDEVRSGPHGFTFAQVQDLANQAGVRHALIRRAPGQPVPVPSIVNWKMHHYAAIVGEQDGRYHIKDPTFGGGDLWITEAAIDAESSGYFLVPDKGERQSRVWQTASAAEAQTIYGMGDTGTSQNGSTTPCDQKTTPADGTGVAMCTANTTSMVVSLSIMDTPVGYTPQKGPPAQMRLTYNQREAYQPAVFSFFNVSPKWTLNVLSWVQDNPTSPGRSVLRYVTSGGAIDYSIDYSYNTSTGAFSPERQGQAVLVRIPASGPVTSYELRMPDGSKQVFGKLDGATTSPRRVFLTQIIDPAGNGLTLNYDAQLRLTTVTDATGRNTTFSYENAATPLQVTKITDPFGRSAKLSYDASARLSSITDVIGITSSFTYDGGGLINALTTPYGTSRFSYGSGSDNERFLVSTDPLGFTERVEFRHSAPGISGADPVVPPGYNNTYLQYRNTFYWEKHVYPLAPTDYTKARITHWLHNPANQTSPIIESIKMPLERRIWQKYPGQSTTYYEGSAGTPTQFARVLDDGTTQAHNFTYNAAGKPLTSIDPVGRKTVFTYAVNNVDLLTVQQQTSSGGTLSTIASFTYNAQHLPLTYTDAAGQTTLYAYNGAGQLTAVTNALNQTTSYGFDGFGRLTTMTNANGVVQQSRTYDAFDRVATTTDSEGYVLAYSYDALDRVSKILYPDGTTTQYGYDRLDLVSVKDRLNRVTTYAHDANRRLTSTTDPLQQTTRYGYYENGVLASLTDPKGNVTSWDIDIQSRPTAKRYADGTRETYGYEATTSRPQSITDAKGQSKRFGYTRDSRVSSLTYANTPQPTANVSFTFDSFFPRPSAMVDGIGTTSFQYQPVGTPGALQLATEDGPYSNDTVSYGYDALGRVATRTVDTASENFAYDAIGRTTAHSSVLGAFTRTYLGQTGQLTGQSTGIVGTGWAYDTNARDRRLLAITNSGQARSFAFTTTPENRITAIAESVGGVTQRSWTYGYDDLDRLTGATASTGAAFGYGYDAADNLISINGTAVVPNTANQITTFGSTPYIYDANGNLTDDGVRTYRWDGEDRLVGIGYKGQPSNVTTLRYDGLGRRLGITDTNSAGSTEVRHLWCGETLCQARSAADQITRRYFGEGVAVPQSGQLLYYGRDQIGSVRDVLVAQTGGNVASFDYSPYGDTTLVKGRVTTEFSYAGLYFHGQSGLYLGKYRQFNSHNAHWLSRDPVHETAGSNLYSYTSDNPISYNDPLGLLTNFTGGAGIDGPYIPDMVRALTEAGITNVEATSSNASLGTVGDLAALLPLTHYHGDAEYERYKGKVAIPLAPGEQLNLIGYSYGAVLQAQTALAIAAGGQCVNHLVLIGAPIAQDLLDALLSSPNIAAVDIINLTEQGDPIYAGMSNLELLADAPTLANQFRTGNGTGHFYYAPSTAEGTNRRNTLAKSLYNMGLR